MTDEFNQPTQKPAGQVAVVLAVVADLFFASRLESLAARYGVQLLQADSIARIDELLRACQPNLGLVDLGIRKVDPAAAIHRLKALGVPRVIAFGPHKDLAARSAALEAGADEWVTNQRLIETLAATFGRAEERGTDPESAPQDTPRD